MRIDREGNTCSLTRAICQERRRCTPTATVQVQFIMAYRLGTAPSCPSVITPGEGVGAALSRFPCIHHRSFMVSERSEEPRSHGAINPSALRFAAYLPSVAPLARSRVITGHSGAESLADHRRRRDPCSLGLARPLAEARIKRSDLILIVRQLVPNSQRPLLGVGGWGGKKRRVTASGVTEVEWDLDWLNTNSENASDVAKIDSSYSKIWN